MFERQLRICMCISFALKASSTTVANDNLLLLLLLLLSDMSCDSIQMKYQVLIPVKKVIKIFQNVVYCGYDWHLKD